MDLFALCKAFLPLIKVSKFVCSSDTSLLPIIVVVTRISSFAKSRNLPCVASPVCRGGDDRHIAC